MRHLYLRMRDEEPAAILTVHSMPGSATDADFLALALGRGPRADAPQTPPRDVGHAWVSILQSDNTIVTFGTWGRQRAHPGGVVPDREWQQERWHARDLIESAQFTRSYDITREQRITLDRAREEYEQFGAAAWTPHRNCAVFAAAMIEAATGERLATAHPGLGHLDVHTPAGLAASIAAANHASLHRDFTTTQSPILSR